MIRYKNKQIEKSKRWYKNLNNVWTLNFWIERINR